MAAKIFHKLEQGALNFSIQLLWAGPCNEDKFLLPNLGPKLMKNLTSRIKLEVLKTYLQDLGELPKIFENIICDGRSLLNAI